MDNITIDPDVQRLLEQAYDTYRETESALLGAVLRDGGVYREAREVVSNEMFHNHSYGLIWLACERLFLQDMKIDVITVGDEVERMGETQNVAIGQWSGRALLSRVRQDGLPRNVMTYAEKVQDQSVKRKLDPFFAMCSYWAKNGRTSKDIISDIYSELSKITLYGAQDEHTVSIGTAVSEAYDWTDAAANGKVVGVPTGLIDLDNKLGSLINGNVYILAARPGVGKTALLLSIALNAARTGKRVGLFSLEMSRMQIAQRLISQDSGVDLHTLIQGKLETKDWPNYTQGVENILALPIVINDLSSININQIRQTARKIKAAGGLDLLIVDYIQLAGSDNKKYERRDLEVSAVSRGLKHLANELNVPILAAAQLNRAIEQRGNKRPILSDLRESGSLEQDAYAVVFLYDKDGETNVKQAEIAKHRNGPLGECGLLFKDKIARFENLYKGGSS